MLFLIIIIASFLLQMFLPWWVIAIISFSACGILGKTGKSSFFQPFFAILILWTIVALFKSIPNHHLLANRVAEMFGLTHWYLILLISSLLGAIVAGVSGYCGYKFRKVSR